MNVSFHNPKLPKKIILDCYKCGDCGFVDDLICKTFSSKREEVFVSLSAVGRLK